MTAPQVPEFTGDIPNPTDQTVPQFNTATQTYHNELPQVITAINNVSNFVEQQAQDSENSATAAASSASTSAANANFRGPWSSLTGVLNRPAAVSHNGSTWRLEVASLADVTTSEPSSGNSDWQNITALDNPFTTDAQIIVSGANGVIQTLSPPGDNTGDYSLTYNSATQTIAWGEGGSGAVGAELGAVVLPTIGNGAQTVNLDMDQGAVFVIDMSTTDTAGTLTITASNIPADGFNINIYIRRAGRKTIAFPTGWTWNQGVTPTLDNGSTAYTLINVNRAPFFSATGAAMTVTTEQVAP